VSEPRTRPRFRLKLDQRRAIAGYAFTLPLLVGSLAFVVSPLVQSIAFSFSNLEITSAGYNLRFVGLSNYRYALLVDTHYVQTFTTAVLQMVAEVPAVLVFSFIAAALVNRPFLGRGLARTILFLPVILTAGVIHNLEAQDLMHQIKGAHAILTSQAVQDFLRQVRLPAKFVGYIIDAVNSLPSVIGASGVPILVFMAGLQSIPHSYYEVAEMEGATEWEKLWTITLPLISPLVVTNLIYVIADSLTSMRNPLIQLLRETVWRGAGYGVSVAMSWVYFMVVAFILVIASAVVSRRVFYEK